MFQVGDEITPLNRKFFSWSKGHIGVVVSMTVPDRPDWFIIKFPTLIVSKGRHWEGTAIKTDFRKLTKLEKVLL